MQFKSEAKITDAPASNTLTITTERQIARKKYEAMQSYARGTGDAVMRPGKEDGQGTHVKQIAPALRRHDMVNTRWNMRTGRQDSARGDVKAIS